MGRGRGDGPARPREAGSTEGAPAQGTRGQMSRGTWAGAATPGEPGPPGPGPAPAGPEPGKAQRRADPTARPPGCGQAPNAGVESRSQRPRPPRRGSQRRTRGPGGSGSHRAAQETPARGPAGEEGGEAEWPGCAPRLSFPTRTRGAEGAGLFRPRRPPRPWPWPRPRPRAAPGPWQSSARAHPEPGRERKMSFPAARWRCQLIARGRGCAPGWGPRSQLPARNYREKTGAAAAVKLVIDPSVGPRGSAWR